MWVYFKKQGTFIQFTSDIYIDCKEGKWVVARMAGDMRYQILSFENKENLNLFIAQFELALKHKEPLLTFDEEKPRFTMKLSDSSSSNEDESKEPQADVGIE